jgi:hypothetical protein
MEAEIHKEIIFNVRNDINELKKRVDNLENPKGISSKFLENLWDNDYDARWDNI